MAQQMLPIRSVKQYFNEFIAEPANQNGGVVWLNKNRDQIRANILEAFRKELFGQVVFKLGPEAASMSRDQLASMDGIQNILEQTFRKWRRLCILCSEFGVSFISLEDLRDALTEEEPHAVETTEDTNSETV